MTYSPFFMVILVDAPKLDYSSAESLVKSIYKKGQVGHAWIYLEGEFDGKRVCIEGGQSGELGILEPRYFEQIAAAQKSMENPICCLYKPLSDGFFQLGGGGHTPTFAAKIELTKEKFAEIVNFISRYPFYHYDLAKYQCTFFISQIAALAGLSLDTLVYLPIESYIYFQGEKIRFWNDSAYSTLVLNTPDKLEKLLLKLSNEGSVQNALTWYKKRQK